MFQNLLNLRNGMTHLTMILLAVLVLESAVNAQSNDGPLSDSERSSVMFDLNLKEIMNHPLLKDMDVKQMMDERGVPQDENFDFTKLNRIFGGMQIPNDPMAMQPQPGEDLPMNFFIRFEFSDSAAATNMLNGIKDQGSKTHEVNGKTYYSPDDETTPPNLRIHQLNNSTVEMGTERYVMLENRNVVSKLLAANWKEIPKDAAFRLSVDLESNREMIDMMMEQAKAGAPQEAEMFLGLVNDLAALTIGLDFDSDQLLSLRASGKDSEGTEKLRTAIDGLLGMGKFMGQSQLTNAPLDDEAKKVIGEILGSLKATSDGNTVIVDIKKPEGFDDVAKELMNQ